MPSALSSVDANAVCAIADAASISIMPFASVTVLAAFAKICCGVIVSLFSSGRIIISSSSSESFLLQAEDIKQGAALVLHCRTSAHNMHQDQYF